MIIYRELLKKYIDHVSLQEGVDFLHPNYNDTGLFTKEEWEELLKLSEELQNTYYSKECL